MKMSYFLLFAVLVVYSQAAKRVLKSDCMWSYCAGQGVRGDTTCSSYPYYVYSGNKRGAGCGFAKFQFECCNTYQTEGDPYHVIKNDCVWSYCAGGTISGKETCSSYAGYTYSGKWKASDCPFTSSRVECCKFQKVEGKHCRRTRVCASTDYYTSSYTCRTDYGGSYVPVVENEGDKQQCSGINAYSYVCCTES